jgi:single-strand DNA-binding protein
VFQQCIIIGNLGRDPEMRYTPEGIPVTTFTLEGSVSYAWLFVSIRGTMKRGLNA